MSKQKNLSSFSNYLRIIYCFVKTGVKRKFGFPKERHSQGKSCALLNSVQKFIEIQCWLLLTFFICLHNQLNSLNSIILQISEKRDLSSRL